MIMQQLIHDRCVVFADLEREGSTQGYQGGILVNGKRDGEIRCWQLLGSGGEESMMLVAQLTRRLCAKSPFDV